jgi:hypothetical protein
MQLKNFKEKMIEKAQKKGYIWENFGQSELIKLRDKIINISDYSNEMNAKREELQELSDWSSNFDLSQMKK